MEDRLEIIEEYELLGERRYRVRVKDTVLVFNVRADTPEEAKSKALELMRRLGIESILEAFSVKEAR